MPTTSRCFLIERPRLLSASTDSKSCSDDARSSSSSSLTRLTTAKTESCSTRPRWSRFKTRYPRSSRPLRIMQDLVNGVVRKKTKADLPRSISDTVKKLDSYGLPEPLRVLYRNYWSNGGARIRDYRVLDQHYQNIAQCVFLQAAPSKKVLLLFPDNPEKHGRGDLSYDEQVCGISVLRIGFDDLHEFIEAVAEFFGYEPGQLNQTIGMSQLGDLRPFRKRTIAFLYEAPVVRGSEGKLQMNISGVRFGQLEDGRLEVQKMHLSEERLNQLRRTSGSDSEPQA